MALHPVFRLREEPTEGILQLLDSAVLGTNGARYRHLDTREKMDECDHPLHLSMERNEMVLGNISFCRRKEHWYIRYFAFSSLVQSGGKTKSKAGGEGLLKRELEQFFQDVFHGEYETPVQSFYAYVDPHNARSLWMSENFRFQTIASVATQTFSRTRPKAQPDVFRSDDWREIADRVASNYGNHAFYTTVQSEKGPFYVLRDPNGKVLAGARFYKASWSFERLPGRFGGLLTRLIPWIPGLNKIIRPDRHVFLVPEAVFVENNDPKLLSRLFEGMLYHEKEHLLIWWVDEREPLYLGAQTTLNWGLLHRVTGVHKANVVCRSANDSLTKEERCIYTVGLDFI